VLIVDDDEAARYVLRALLVGLGHATREASGGEDGLRQALADLPGSVVLDLVMPGMSGSEVLRRLRAVPETELVPVVVATSKVPDTAERAEIERLSAILFAKSETTGPGAPKALADAMWRARLAVGAGDPCQRGSSPEPALSEAGPRS
jgi:CheY-like chemotaxis protein